MEAIDDPACAIEEEVEGIPQGAGAIGFLLGYRYWLMDKILRSLLKRLDRQYFRLPATLTVALVFQVPSGLVVGQPATQRRIADMYPLSDGIYVVARQSTLLELRIVNGLLSYSKLDQRILWISKSMWISFLKLRRPKKAERSLATGFPSRPAVAYTTTRYSAAPRAMLLSLNCTRCQDCKAKSTSRQYPNRSQEACIKE